MSLRLPTLLALAGDIALLDKPPGLTADGDEAEWRAVLERAGWTAPPAWQVALRLDRDASGVVAFARTPAVREAFLAQDPPPQREYLVLVVGYVPGDGVANCPVGFDRRTQRLRPARGRKSTAVTHYRIETRLRGHTLLRCVTEPDHPTNLRVHLQQAGFPLAVDPLYGGGEAVFLSHLKADYRASRRRDERPLIARLSMHAANARFIDPLTGVPRIVDAEPAKDLRATVQQLARLV